MYAKKVFPGLKVKPSKGSQQGMKYVAAGGHEIPNRGEVKVEGVTEQGAKLNLTYQDAAVDMPILSVGELADTDHKVDFEKHGGEIIHKPTNTITPFIRRAGVYFVKLLVPRSAVEVSDPMEVDEGKSKSSGFRRPGNP